MFNEACEYTVSKKSEGGYRLHRLAMLLFYVVFIAAFFVTLYKIGIIQVFALAPLLLWILIFFTWRYVSVEYKYRVESGKLIFFNVYGSKTHKQKATFHLKAAEAFLPLEEAKTLIDEYKPQKTYSFLSSAKAPKDAYAFMIKDNGKRTLVLLEAPLSPRKEIVYYLSDAVKGKSA